MKHRIWTGVLPDGQEVLVQVWDREEDDPETYASHAEVAFRERPDTTITWGPPITLKEKPVIRP